MGARPDPVPGLAAPLRRCPRRSASPRRCAARPRSAACSSTRRSTRSPAPPTALGLTMVQLHGDEGPSYCAEVARRTGAKVVKAARVRGGADINALEAFHTDYHLLDAHQPGRYGRHGGDVRLGARPPAAHDDPVHPQRRPEPGERRRRDRRDVARSRSTRPAAPRSGPGSRTPRGCAPSPPRSPRPRRSRTPSRASPSIAADGRRLEHRFGPYGGQYVPETLMPALAELETAWLAARARPVLRRGARRPVPRLLPAGRRRCTSPSASARPPAARSGSSART